MSISDDNRKKKMKVTRYGFILTAMKKYIDDGGNFYNLDFSDIEEKDRDAYIKAMKKYDFNKKTKGIDL
jgi:spore germination protein YaaH